MFYLFPWKQHVCHVYQVYNMSYAVLSFYNYCYQPINLRIKVILRTNPWVVLAGSLFTSIPLAMGTLATDIYSEPILKHVFWIGFNLSVASSLSVLGFAGGPVISQAILATGCMVSRQLLHHSHLSYTSLIPLSRLSHLSQLFRAITLILTYNRLEV